MIGKPRTVRTIDYAINCIRTLPNNYEDLVKDGAQHVL